MPSDFNKFRWHEDAMRMTRGITSRVAGVMFERADMDGTRVYINNENLAKELGCNEKSIRRARKDLESLGLVKLERKGHNMVDGSSRTSSEFALTMPVTQPDISMSDEAAGSPTTGHSPHNRTSVSPQLDTHVHLIDPGNKPGSSKTLEPDTGVSGSPNRTSEMSGAPEFEVATEREAMRDKSDPWNEAIDYADAVAEEHFAALEVAASRSRQETFVCPNVQDDEMSRELTRANEAAGHKQRQVAEIMDKIRELRRESPGTAQEGDIQRLLQEAVAITE